ncbi:hypothetical protein GJ689_08995 [Rhodoplanes serenus]|jgi:vancomycin permeability regulator SanA|uniref:Uncharacterized protein n=1 Tax=Rhodoplanes serenus TaxID=200615 RepID=A0A327K7G5_9BRAD|nr:hypothetical protein [Rhodoplanes serenus]MBI5112621.1 hypothetical protein [Rhodovulum sp.]MTW16346.1 hypothetical protein [Rhodoplanes serenus]RAI34650.1 hypothetical protein CH340_08440 [Rhodoplanes serenus]VCU11119.1 hypothetical protein RHODGE_RHODGE_04324 [Rhodoplanes serenus]
MTRIVLAATVALVTSGAAIAQTTEYYIVQDTATKRCTVVDKKPTTQTTVVVGDGKVYTTRTEAESAVKTVKVCSP